MRHSRLASFASGTVIGLLGGLIGLGGAEFRLPLLIKTFGFAALDAVILNKSISLVVVASALPFRAGTVSIATLIEHWPIILNLLAGSILGAWFGAGWAIKLKAEIFYKLIAVLLVFIALILLFSHHFESALLSSFSSNTHIIIGVMAGFIIGVVAALLGVAGGELLIPTLVILFGADIKLAGSLSLAVSLPTMLTSFGRYSLDQSFSVLEKNCEFVLLMAIGSLLGAFIGGQLLGIIPTFILLPFLSMILLFSAVKLWNHQ
jgi:uncharacterized membrane protein YfcA